MSTPSNTSRDSPLQLPSKPPDSPNAHNPPEELREVIPSNSTSGDPEDPAVLDEIALMQKLIRQHQEKLDALQKRKRSNAGSNPPSDTGEAGADDSDLSSHRPKKARKLGRSSIAQPDSAQGPDSNLDDSPSTTSQLQTDGPAVLLAPSPSDSRANSSKRLARVSLEDPAASTDRARGQSCPTAFPSMWPSCRIITKLTP